MKDNIISSQAFDPTEYADPLFGVGSATSAGPTLPAGSIHPSPETLECDNGGYLRNQPIVGFGNAYISGSGGKKCYGNFLLSPTLGEIELDRERRAVYAKEGSERARCYEYAVELENGISVKVTPAHSSAIYSIEYPEGSDASLLIDVAHKLDIDASLKHGSVTVSPEKRRITGGGRFFGNWNELDWDMYFALEIDAEPIEISIFEGDRIHTVSENTCVSISEEKRLGAFIKISKAQKSTVKVKIAISFTSEEHAAKTLAQEIPDFDYERVKAAAKEKWQGILSAIEIDTADKALLRRFYTAMYHMNIQPRDRTRDLGKWDDFHTVWDTWKTTFPLYSLIYPEKMGAIIDSMIDRARENLANGVGIVLGDEYLTGQETLAGQGGNDVENVIVDSFIKGVPLKRHTWEEAYEVLLASATMMRSPEYIERGYAYEAKTTASGVPYTWRMKPAGGTMGFALNDKAIANMARAIGKAEDYKKFEARSKNWLNVWNKKNESEGFLGFPQKRNADGTFDEGFDPHGGYNKHFYEATAWDASYINYNDHEGLIEAMGGADEFTRRLKFACDHSVNYYNDDHGKEGYLNFTNEPSFHIPWLFCVDEICRPDLAAEVIDRIIKRFSLENDYPGDEDNGGMSSYYVFLMSGFFPFATTESYYLHGTRLNKIVFHLAGGKSLVITGENVGEGNIFVQSATWCGKVLDRCSLTHEEIARGGTLHFVMGDTPSSWAHRKIN
ncbi:MAG: GH92 family glycosyl hydrolase [Clostridia bacterium]|nr:GH92 family glycosyl hydrolase [Clostridia bacterium]